MRFLRPFCAKYFEEIYCVDFKATNLQGAYRVKEVLYDRVQRELDNLQKIQIQGLTNSTTFKQHLSVAKYPQMFKIGAN